MTRLILSFLTEENLSYLFWCLSSYCKVSSSHCDKSLLLMTEDCLIGYNLHVALVGHHCYADLWQLIGSVLFIVAFSVWSLSFCSTRHFAPGGSTTKCLCLSQREVTASQLACGTTDQCSEVKHCQTHDFLLAVIWGMNIFCFYFLVAFVLSNVCCK